LSFALRFVKASPSRVPTTLNNFEQLSVCFSQ